MSKADQRHKQAAALLAELQIQHSVLKHYKALDEEGVEQTLIETHAEKPAWLIRLALHQHLNSNAYLQSLSHGGARFDLREQPSGEVDNDTRHHARALLKHHHAHSGRKTKH